MKVGKETAIGVLKAISKIDTNQLTVSEIIRFQEAQQETEKQIEAGSSEIDITTLKILDKEKLVELTKSYLNLGAAIELIKLVGE